MKKVSIYGLFDPRLPDVIMYVGKGGDNRPAQHWRIFIKTCVTVNALLRHWFVKLFSEGVIPSWRFLEKEVTDWQAAERKWIAYWREKNPDLCNVADGGNAWPLNSSSLGGQIGGRTNANKPGFLRSIGQLASPELRSKSGYRLHELHPGMAHEWGRRGALALRGNLSDEARRKMSEAKKGKPSPRKGVTVSLESRQRMREAALRRWASKHDAA